MDAELDKVFETGRAHSKQMAHLYSLVTQRECGHLHTHPEEHSHKTGKVICLDCNREILCNHPLGSVDQNEHMAVCGECGKDITSEIAIDEPEDDEL